MEDSVNLRLMADIDSPPLTAHRLLYVLSSCHISFLQLFLKSGSQRLPPIILLRRLDT